MKKQNRFLPILTAILIGLSFFYCQGRKVVARIGNQIISLQDFKQSYPGDGGQALAEKLPYEHALAHLNDLIDTKLKLLDAYRSGLDKEKEILEKINQSERKEVYQMVIEREILDKVVPESVLKGKYRQQAKEVKLRQIFLPIVKGKDGTDNKELVLRQLDSLRYRTYRGEDFEALARAFSMDPVTSGKGGDLGFIRWGKGNYGDEFYRAAVELKPGEVSRPVISKRGGHLLKAESIRSVEQPPYQQERERLQQTFYRDKRNDLQKLYLALVDELQKKYHVKYDQESINLMVNKVHETVADSASQATSMTPANQFAKISPDDQSKLLVEYDGGSCTIGQLIAEMGKLPPYRQKGFENAANLQSLLTRKITPDLIIQWGYAKGFHKSKTVREKILQQKEELMVEAIERQKVTDKLDQSEQSFKNYFQENSDYYWEKEKFQVQEIYLPDGQLAEQLVQRANRQENFDKLAEKYNERTETKGKKGMLGFISEEQYGAIGKRVGQMKIGEIAGPIKMGKSYSVIKLLGKQAARPQTYAEARKQIVLDYRKKTQEALRRRWMEELRRNLNVQIYEGALRQAVSAS